MMTQTSSPCMDERNLRCTEYHVIQSSTADKEVSAKRFTVTETSNQGGRRWRIFNSRLRRKEVTSQQEVVSSAILLPEVIRAKLGATTKNRRTTKFILKLLSLPNHLFSQAPNENSHLDKKRQRGRNSHNSSRQSLL